MAHSHTGRKRPVHGKANRRLSATQNIKTIRHSEKDDGLAILQLRKDTEQKTEEKDLSLTDMISNAVDEAEESDRELSLTAMISTALIEAEEKEDDLSLTEMIRSATEEAVERTDGHTLDEPVFREYIEVHPDEEDDQQRSGGLLGKVLIVLGALALVAAGALLYLWLSGNLSFSKPDEHAVIPSEEETASVPSDDPEPYASADPLDDLKTEVTAFVADAEGVWSVYLEDLKSGNSFVINDRQMSSASLIKLFTAGTYLEAVENGNIAETDLSAWWLKMMITWSDNEAWEELEAYIGYGDYTAGLMAVTDFAQRIGCPYSGREIGSESIWDEDADNLSKAAEIGKVLHDIYIGTFVSKEASERMYDLLKEQNITYKIAAGLPEGFTFGSKSGELDSVENDAAIVHGTDTDYILVIMSNEIYDSEEAVHNITEISWMCASYLNPSINW